MASGLSMGAVPVVSPYVLFNGLALAAGLLLVDRRLNERLPHKQHAAYVLLVFAVVVAWLGAHVFEQLVSGRPFSRAGFVFYGGLLSGLALFAAVGHVFLSRDELVTTADAAVVPLLVAQGVGRIGCWLAGCCFGIPIGYEGLRHPTQLYESGFVLLLAAWLVRRRARVAPGDSAMYLAAYPIFRFAVEFLRGDSRGMALGLSTSQWISIPLAVSALYWCSRASSGAASRRRVCP